MAGPLFYYFGDDEAYFKSLIGEFNKHSRLNPEFKRIYETTESKIQSLFHKVLKDRPICIFIDLSKHTQDYIHLARILTRAKLEHEYICVGLLDYLSPVEVMIESIATGVQLTHIKSAEIYNVVFDTLKLIAPKEIDSHGFATATLKEEWEAGIPVKVGFVHRDGIHFETDYPLQKGDRIRMNHAWTEKKTVPSKEFFVTDISTKNLFYHFSRGVDAEFLFIDDFLPPEGMEQERIDEKKAERTELIERHKKQLSQWVDDNLTRSLEKKAKVLVVDSSYPLYLDQARTDKHSYTIRCLGSFQDIGSDLDRMMPQVIAFTLDKPGVPSQKNTIEELGKLTAALKVKQPDSHPFLIVFNCTETSKGLQEKLQYPQILSSAEELSVELLLRMATIFEKKLNDNLSKTTSNAKGEEKVYLKNTNSSSIAEILTRIQVLKISETDMIIECESPLPIGINLHLTNPVNMFINIQPSKSQGKTPQYLGLIHCIGEHDKKELRRFVNSVFFREHDAKLTAETNEFKKLNEQKLQEKAQELKLAEEEALKAKEEAKKEEKKDPEP